MILPALQTCLVYYRVDCLRDFGGAVCLLAGDSVKREFGGCQDGFFECVSFFGADRVVGAVVQLHDQEWRGCVRVIEDEVHVIPTDFSEPVATAGLWCDDNISEPDFAEDAVFSFAGLEQRYQKARSPLLRSRLARVKGIASGEGGSRSMAGTERIGGNGARLPRFRDPGVTGLRSGMKADFRGMARALGGLGCDMIGVCFAEGLVPFSFR